MRSDYSAMDPGVSHQLSIVLDSCARFNGLLQTPRRKEADGKPPSEGRYVHPVQGSIPLPLLQRIHCAVTPAPFPPRHFQSR